MSEYFEPEHYLPHRKPMCVLTRVINVAEKSVEAEADLDADGVFAADGTGDVWYPCCPAQMRSATGAGDAFAAALGWAFLAGKNLAESAKAANAAASIAVEGEETINPALSPERVQERMTQQEEPL